MIKNKHSGKDITIFSEMTALAVKHHAVNLSQGFPDFEIDPLLKKYLADGTEQNFNQYSPMTGFQPLIENLITYNKVRKNPLDVSTSELTVTPGATYGIYCALATILLPGDEVIILEPSYDSYIPAIETNGGKAVTVSLKENFEPDFEKISSEINEKTKAIIINSPHNPSGKIWKNDDFEKLWQIIKDSEIIIISDEVYDLLTYDEHIFTSAFHHPKLKERCFSVFSFGKMFSITGWKVGYVVASEKLTKAFRKVHQYLCFSVNTPAQFALAKYLEVFDVEENRKKFEQKRDFFIAEFKNLPFKIKEKAEGGYFQLAEYESSSIQNDKKHAQWLTVEKKVASIPVSAFYNDERNTGMLRFCFAKKEETILNAVENLRKLL